MKMSSTTMTTTTRMARIQSDTATTSMNHAGLSSIPGNSSQSFEVGKSSVPAHQMTKDFYHSQWIVNVQSAMAQREIYSELAHFKKGQR